MSNVDIYGGKTIACIHVVRLWKLHLFRKLGGGGGAVAQSVERAAPGEEVPGSIPAGAARSLLVGSVSV